jgi:hypothetical protein
VSFRPIRRWFLYFYNVFQPADGAPIELNFGDHVLRGEKQFENVSFEFRGIFGVQAFDQLAKGCQCLQLESFQALFIFHPHNPKVKLDRSPDLNAPAPMLCRWAVTTLISVAFEAPAAPC